MRLDAVLSNTSAGKHTANDPKLAHTGRSLWGRSKESLPLIVLAV